MEKTVTIQKKNTELKDFNKEDLEVLRDIKRGLQDILDGNLKEV